MVADTQADGAAHRAAGGPSASTAGERRASSQATSATIAPQETILEAALRRIHFSRPDGRVCFSGAAGDKTNFELPAEARALRTTARRAAARDGRPAASFKGLPKPAAAYHSERARCSLLRTDWSAGAAQLAIDWSSPDLRLEFQLGRDTVFAGRSAPGVSLDGTTLQPIDDWHEVVWLSDVDADYLELEIELTGGARLQRQFLLTRREGWLYVADVLFAEERSAVDQRSANKAAADLDVRLTLPCVDKCRFTPATDTCEGTLTLGRRQAAVVPPGLAEWRSAERTGSLSLERGELAVRMKAPHARALYVPLAIQFDPARARKPLTWRQLTVGENLSIVPAERAVGYRLQFGREHWLVYRSLTPRANRTVLGVNLQTDFLFSRFSKDGKSEPLVEVE